jgi:hypothetical protein
VLQAYGDLGKVDVEVEEKGTSIHETIMSTMLATWNNGDSTHLKCWLKVRPKRGQGAKYVQPIKFNRGKKDKIE